MKKKLNMKMAIHRVHTAYTHSSTIELQLATRKINTEEEKMWKKYRLNEAKQKLFILKANNL